MEYFMVFLAFFLFFFGAALVNTALVYGVVIGHYMLQATGHVVKCFLEMMRKGLVLLGRMVYQRYSKTDSGMKIRPLYVSAVELQHLRNKNLVRSDKRMPVEIEYFQQKKGN